MEARGAAAAGVGGGSARGGGRSDRVIDEAPDESFFGG